jgi:mannose-6-phosphate isomerase-like protein (cupin superfamily)
MLYDMKLERLRFKKSFRVIRGNRRAQAAEMVITPGNSEGDPRNRHRGADQWLFVVAGRGDAIVKGRRYKLVPGSLIFIARGERHDQGERSNAASHAQLLRAAVRGERRAAAAPTPLRKV